MPKNKVQDAVFTAIMAIIMVYGMIVYNVALNTGGVTSETFLLALHELPIMAADRVYSGIFRRRQACKAPRIFVHETYRPPAVHHLCRFHLHLLHHVSYHEPDCDHAF